MWSSGALVTVVCLLTLILLPIVKHQDAGTWVIRSNTRPDLLHEPDLASIDGSQMIATSTESTLDYNISHLQWSDQVTSLWDPIDVVTRHHRGLNALSATTESTRFDETDTSTITDVTGARTSIEHRNAYTYDGKSTETDVDAVSHVYKAFTPPYRSSPKSHHQPASYHRHPAVDKNTGAGNDRPIYKLHSNENSKEHPRHSGQHSVGVKPSALKDAGLHLSHGGHHREQGVVTPLSTHHTNTVAKSDHIKSTLGGAMSSNEIAQKFEDLLDRNSDTASSGMFDRAMMDIMINPLQSKLQNRQHSSDPRHHSTSPLKHHNSTTPVQHRPPADSYESRIHLASNPVNHENSVMSHSHHHHHMKTPANQEPTRSHLDSEFMDILDFLDPVTTTEPTVHRSSKDNRRNPTIHHRGNKQKDVLLSSSGNHHLPTRNIKVKDHVNVNKVSKPLAPQFLPQPSDSKKPNRQLPHRTGYKATRTSNGADSSLSLQTGRGHHHRSKRVRRSLMDSGRVSQRSGRHSPLHSQAEQRSSDVTERVSAGDLAIPGAATEATVTHWWWFLAAAVVCSLWGTAPTGDLIVNSNGGSGSGKVRGSDVDTRLRQLSRWRLMGSCAVLALLAALMHALLVYGVVARLTGALLLLPAAAAVLSGATLPLLLVPCWWSAEPTLSDSEWRQRRRLSGTTSLARAFSAVSGCKQLLLLATALFLSTALTTAESQLMYPLATSVGTLNPPLVPLSAAVALMSHLFVHICHRPIIHHCGLLGTLMLAFLAITARCLCCVSVGGWLGVMVSQLFCGLTDTLIQCLLLLYVDRVSLYVEEECDMWRALEFCQWLAAVVAPSIFGAVFQFAGGVTCFVLMANGAAVLAVGFYIIGRCSSLDLSSTPQHKLWRNQSDERTALTSTTDRRAENGDWPASAVNDSDWLKQALLDYGVR